MRKANTMKNKILANIYSFAGASTMALGLAAALRGRNANW